MSAPAPAEDVRPMPTALRAAIVLALLYLFLAGISVLEGGISSLGEGVQESLFSSVSNPIAGLCVGILATVLVQSSSVSTSTVVGLVSTGLLSVDDAVPIVMGANLGTTVTSTLAALGHVRRPEEFRHAFAAATVHDFFNLLTVVVMLPIELATGVLSKTARWLTEALVGQDGAEFDSPIKKIVERPSEAIIDGVGNLVSGTALGIVLIGLALGMIFVALAFITKNMRVLVATRIERSVGELLERGGGTAAIALGMVITIAVQSSSITTSVMVPLAAAGIVTTRNVYPMAIGANIGTTATALLAAMAASRPEAITIALVHTLFNVSGTLLYYPVPAMRALPVRLADGLAEMAMRRRSAVLAYVVVTFLVVPAFGVLLLR
ncbi:MAG TPA: Na/Pi symporter [Acidimicrobiales bacterium]|nr:Na/Pi symporter [Acidimicrobiales bacterium]